MDISRKLIKGSIVRIANFILQAVVAFFMMPFIVHSLGDRMYGFWVLIATFIGYYGLLDLGLSSATQRHISRAIGKNDVKEMNEVVNTTLFLFLRIGLIALFISIIASIFCIYFIKNPEEISLFRKIIVLLGFGIAVGFPMRVFVGILDSNLRYDLSSYASIAKTIIGNAFIYYYLKNGYGILALALITFFINLLEYSLVILFSKLSIPQFKISYSLYRKEILKPLFKYSGNTFIAQLGDILRFRVSSFVIATFLNVSLVTYYSVGSRLIEYFTQFITSSLGIMLPVFSQYESIGDFDNIRKKFLDVTKISVIISVFIGTSIFYYGEYFIQRWMGPGFESSYYVAVILCLPYIIALMQNPSIGLLYGISKNNYLAIANTSEGVINLVLSLILVRYYGIYGIALGNAIAMLIFKLLIQPFYVCRIIKLSVKKYYFNTLFITTIKTVAPLLIYFYIIKDFIKADYTIILISVSIQILLSIPIIYLFVLNEKERRFIKGSFGFVYGKN